MTDRADIARSMLMQRFMGPRGQIQRGNLDLNARPMVWNPEGGGGYSTVRSMSFGDGGREVLVPTVSEQGLLTPDQAVQRYDQTGQHLGMFKTPEAAERYAQRLHEDQARQYFGASWAGP